MNILDKEISKYKLRKQQIDTFEDFKKHETDNKFFLLDIPVGSGKSLIAMLLSKFYMDSNKNTKVDMVTNSKILQSQYTDEFKSISNLWGRDGYECNSFPTSCSQGKDLAKLTKNKCENCPYDYAKGDYMNGQISLTNMHMFITLHLYQSEMLKNLRESNRILIIDEAHLFEQIFSDYISVSFSDRTLKKLSFTDADIKSINKDVENVKVISDMYKYLKYNLHKKINDKISDLESEVSKFSDVQISRSIKLDVIVDISRKDNEHVKKLKCKIDLENKSSRITKFLADYEKNASNWVLDVDKKTNSYSLQTVWAREHIASTIWDKYDKVIFLSGTILNKELFCFVNGLNATKTHYYNLPSSFPIKNRPIYYMPVGRMSYKEKSKTIVDIGTYVNKILKKYKGKKGIIHTNTFEIANYLKENVKTDRFLFHDDGDRDYMLKKHYNSDEATVIVSPSMTTGIDLKDDYGRFGVMTKIPYPSLESNKNKARLSTNQDWYNYMTVLAIIQAYGRNVRSETDYADFIILDSCFSDIMRNCDKFMPHYMQMAIKVVDIKKLN